MAARRLRALSSARRAKVSAWFFKTGPGEYGEGDRFLGITVPTLRRETRAFDKIEIVEIERLLASPWHEERLFALLILVRRYERAKIAERSRIFRFYLAHLDRVNNWDLVDLSAPSIVGEHLAGGGRAVLRRLVRSPVLWERRIAIVSTFAFLRRGEVRPTFELAHRLLRDPEELIHKAAGWALREAGKKDLGALRAFLARNAGLMPRTMLRYAIERLPERERRAWLAAPSRRKLKLR
jgi:3-methyladenine DNA glycosylase AlkD